jgi:hypothetical protein
MEARPPYVEFERVAEERRKSAEEGGTVYYVDVDYAKVTALGSKDTTVKSVGDWFPRLAEEARQGRYPQAWLDHFKAKYAAWKTDQELPVNGIPIKTWPGASPAEVKILLALHVLTIEDLAAGNDELIGRIGMGGRSLQNRARDWMTGLKGQGTLVAQIDALRQVIAGLEHRLEATETRAKLAEQRVIAAERAAQPQIQYIPTPAARVAQAAGPNEDALIADAVGDVLNG